MVCTVCITLPPGDINSEAGSPPCYGVANSPIALLLLPITDINSNQSSQPILFLFSWCWLRFWWLWYVLLVIVYPGSEVPATVWPGAGDDRVQPGPRSDLVHTHLCKSSVRPSIRLRLCTLCSDFTGASPEFYLAEMSLTLYWAWPTPLRETLPAISTISTTKYHEGEKLSNTQIWGLFELCKVYLIPK